jgi:hypothetical protein
MAQIITRFFNYVPDKALLLGGEEWLRPLGHLGDWMRLRIGMLIAFRSTAATTFHDGMLTLGLTSGRSNTMSKILCEHALGLSVCGSVVGGTGRSWTYFAGSGNPYFSPAASGNFYRRWRNPANGVDTTAVVTHASTPIFAVAGVGIKKRRSPIVLDILKNPTTGQCTFSVFFPANAATEDYRADHLLDAVDQMGTPVISGQTWTAPTAQVLTLTELTGALDTLSIFWSNQAYPLELYAVCANVYTDAGTPQPSYPFLAGGFDDFLSQAPGPVTLLNSGSGFSGPYVLQGISNVVTTYGLAGTSSGVDDSFDQYSLGTVVSGSLDGGTNWSGPWLASGGTYSNSSVLGMSNDWYGTTVGNDDTFDQYQSGSAAMLALGTNWSGPFYARYFAGTTYPNEAAQVGLAGTSAGFPWDNFNSYSLGSITLLDGGTGWQSYGTFYSY